MEIELSDIGMSFAVAFLVAIALVLYFLPFIVAFRRGHPGTQAVFIANLTLGWTVIVWIIVLVAAFMAKGENLAPRRD